MSLNLRVIEMNEIEEILEFETRKLKEQFPEDIEAMMQAWHAKWRKEALEHYLKTGWSFLARNKDRASTHSPEGELVGYFLAQPLLFFDGQTQSLWVEHIQFSSLQARDEICDLAYRLAREKHFQKVYFPATQNIAPTLKSMKATDWNSHAVFINTTKV
jgi:hypothetical protein